MLVINLMKSDLYPMQDLVYIGARFHTDLGRLYLPVSRIQDLITSARGFSRVGSYKLALLFLDLLGLMAATLQMEYAHLHMCSIQWYLEQWWNHVTHGLCHPILVSKDLALLLSWWLDREPLPQGMPFSSSTITIITDVTWRGGAVTGECEGWEWQCSATSRLVWNDNSTSMCWSSGQST